MVFIKSSHIFLGLSLFASLLSVKAGLAEDVCTRVNQERAKVGCKPVKLNSKLMDVAQRHNQYCVNNHILTHADPAGSLGDRFKQCGYDFSSAGENIAEGFGNDDAEGVMNAWMNSPGHRDNILNPEFCDMGCVCEDGFCTQDFGKPMNGGESDDSDNSGNPDGSDNSGSHHHGHNKPEVSSDDDNSEPHYKSHRKPHFRPQHDNNVESPSNDDNNDDNDGDDNDDPAEYGNLPKPGYKTVPFGKKPCPKKQ